MSSAGAKATPLSLNDALGLAMTRDADVERARRSLEIARLQVANARTGYLPTASVNVAANQSATGSTYRAEDIAFRRGLSGNFVGTLSANVEMAVDISGSIKRGVKAAQVQRGLAEIADQRAGQDALVDVQIAYLTALQAQRMVEIDQSIVTSMEAIKRQASKTLPSVVPFLDVELANARQMLRAGQAVADQVEDGLKLALRLPLELDLQLTSALPKVSALPPLETLKPDEKAQLDMLAAKGRVDASLIAVEQAKDRKRPSLRVGAYATQTLSGRFVDEVGRSSNRDYGLNVSLSLPLLNFDAGRGDNSIRTTELFAEQAMSDLETARLGAELGVRQAGMALTRARQRMKALPDAKAAGQALELATRALFETDPDDAPALIAQVSNARANWRGALAASIDAETGVLIAALRLSRALGQPIQLAEPGKPPSGSMPGPSDRLAGANPGS